MDHLTSDGPTGMPARPLMVLVVARQPIARAGISALLGERGDLLVVGQASGAEEAVRRSAELHPDVVVASVGRSEPSEGATLAEAIGSGGPPLLLLVDRLNELDLRGVLRAGARGVLSGEAGPDEVSAALHAITAGLLVLDPSLGVAVAASGSRLMMDPDVAEPLTEREAEVLRLIALGLANKSIARQLGISEHTVKFHVGSILGKLNAGSRTDAVTRAARQGLIAL